MRHGSENQIATLVMRPGVASLDSDMQAALPRGERGLAIGGRRRAFVGDVVGDAGKRVHRGNMRPHVPGQHPRRDRKVFIVRSRQRLTRGVGSRERSRHWGIVR